MDEPIDQKTICDSCGGTIDIAKVQAVCNLRMRYMLSVKCVACVYQDISTHFRLCRPPIKRLLPRTTAQGKVPDRFVEWLNGH